MNGTWGARFEYDDDGLLTLAGALSITRDAHHGLVTATTLANVTTAQTWSGFGK